jgi:tripartite-type tricarboxylate transporter receptor subunit TctC
MSRLWRNTHLPLFEVMMKIHTLVNNFILKWLAVAAIGCFAISSVHAAYPEKPIRWIIPFPPGGAMDSIARSVGEQLSRKLGQPVVIENKAGAGGNLGVDFAAKSPADGYTMVITSIGMVTNRHLYAKLSYDPIKDFAPVSMLAVVPNMLVVNPTKVKAKNLRDLIAEVKARPGKLTYASAGNGTSIHLAGELFTSMTGLDIQHIPYRGSGPAVSDLLGGQVDMMFDSVSSARPYVQAGKLNALGVTTSKRSTAMPEVPTIAEAGVPGYVLSPWFGVFMPASTPPDIVKFMNAALIEAMGRTEVKARFSVLGAEVVGSTPEAFASSLVTESAKWEKLIREKNIQPD